MGRCGRMGSRFRRVWGCSREGKDKGNSVDAEDAE